MKMVNKKAVAIITSVILTATLFNTNLALASNISTTHDNNIYGVLPENESLIFSVDSINLRDASTSNEIAEEISGDALESIKLLNEGTIVSRFKINSTEIQSLIGISNGNSGQQNSYFHLYVKNNRVGFEIRRTSGGDIAKYYVDVPLNIGEVHTVAMSASAQEGYNIYLDGSLVLTVTVDKLTNGYGFLSSIPGVNKGFIGKTYRATATNGYPFAGDIYYLGVYNEVLSELDLTYITSNPVEQFRSNEYKIFDKLEHQDSGTLNSNSFRIPSMISTDNDVIIAAADIRYGNSDDSPNNIDIGIRRSLDDGKTWEDPQLVMNFTDYENKPTSKISNSASFIDSILVKGDNNRIFLICDAFRGGMGQPNCTETSGYITIDGSSYLALYDSSNNVYTVREDGVVYDNQNNITRYTVHDWFALYEDGVYKSNIFYASSPLKVAPTSFLVMSYSDDDGQTWASPQILNGQVKSDDMRFFGVGPGIGLQLKNDPNYEGRLIVPIYFDSTSTKGQYRGMMIYSDDNGETWHSGEPTPLWEPNDGKTPTTAVFYEIQMVEMPDGQVKMFSRTNSRGKAIVATSFDGGVSWQEPYFENQLVMSSTSGCQLSIINYSKKIGGKDAVIFSNPAATTRRNGTIRVGFIEENGVHENGRTKYEFNWAHSKVIRSGEFAYSSLIELPNGNIGILCEEDKDAGQLDYLQYIEFDINYLTGHQYEIASINEITALKTENLLSLSVKFDKSVEIFGEKSISIVNNGQTYIAEYIGKNKQEDTMYFECKVDNAFMGNTVAVFNVDTEICGMFGAVFNDYAEKTVNVYDDSIVFTAENMVFSGQNTINKSEYLSNISMLSEGTVIVKFKTTVDSRERKVMIAASRSTGVNNQSSMSEFSLSIENGYIRHDIIENGVKIFSANYPAGGKVNDGEIHTVAFVSTDSGNKIYLDNQDITVYPQYNQFISDTTGLDSLCIGGLKSYSGETNLFNGEIELINIINRPLSQDELIQLY